MIISDEIKDNRNEVTLEKQNLSENKRIYLASNDMTTENLVKLAKKEFDF